MIQAYAASKPKGKLKPFEYNPGPLGKHEVEIDVRCCGICHSDLSMIDNSWDITEYPIVAGHEVVGTIKALGKEVSHLKVGQRVGLGWHSGYCMTCPSCMGGDHNLCEKEEGTIISHHGGFANKVRASAASVIPIPKGIDDEHAGPLFCAGITVFNPLIQFDVKPTNKVAVIGIGGLGHLALQFLKAWGCEVTAFTSSPQKKKEAKQFGASHTIDSRNPKELEAAKNQFDFILSTVNVHLDWNAYIATLRPKGRLHFVGITLDPLDINLQPLVGGQKSISATPVGSPVNIAKMLEFADRHKIKPMIETFSFEKINEAIERLRSGKARYRIVLSHE